MNAPPAQSIACNVCGAGLPTPLLEMTVGPCFTASALVIDHFMVATALHPIAFARGYPGYVTVHLAALIAPVDPSRLVGARKALRERGFDLEVEPAGLRASADERVARDLAMSARGGERLASVVAILLDTAKALGAQPVP